MGVQHDTTRAYLRKSFTYWGAVAKTVTRQKAMDAHTLRTLVFCGQTRRHQYNIILTRDWTYFCLKYLAHLQFRHRKAYFSPSARHLVEKTKILLLVVSWGRVGAHARPSTARTANLANIDLRQLPFLQILVLFSCILCVFFTSVYAILHFHLLQKMFFLC